MWFKTLLNSGSRNRYFMLLCSMSPPVLGVTFLSPALKEISRTVIEWPWKIRSSVQLVPIKNVLPTNVSRYTLHILRTENGLTRLLNFSIFVEMSVNFTCILSHSIGASIPSDDGWHSGSGRILRKPPIPIQDCRTNCETNCFQPRTIGPWPWLHKVLSFFSKSSDPNL